MRIDEIASPASPQAAATVETAAVSQGVTAHREAAKEKKEEPNAREPGATGEQGSTPEALDKILTTINERLFRVGQRLELYLVEGTDEVAARIIDERTKKVVLEIPPHEIIELRARLDEMVGLLFDKGA